MSARRWVVCAAVAAAGLACAAARADVAATTHNLSVSGPGTVKSSTESQVCLFCHTPHSASPSAALWNRRGSGGTYTPYTSSTARGLAGQPTGASILCLSCHDGTIALGEVLNRATPLEVAGGFSPMPSGRSRVGVDLGDDHPVSFAYTATLAAQRNNELVDPSNLATGKVKLDAGGQLQCTSCHDPHDNTFGRFLVKSNVGSALCITCHRKTGWSASSHATSTRSWNGLGTNPWPASYGTTVADNACEGCHRPHTAPGRRQLLSSAAEENVCNNCHNGNVTTRNIQSEFSKSSRHGVSTLTGTHDAAEPAVVATMHVECVDCHNPHASKATASTVPGPLTGVRGVTINGAAVNPAGYEYEICLRCHGDSTSRTPAPTVVRQIAQGNLRQKFLTSGASFHPVAGPGRSTNVPSLIAPWTTSSRMTCGDCHNNNAGPGAGGTGPKGPHGSIYRPLLERQYVTTDNTAYTTAGYALCFKCHSSTSVLGNVTFREHNKHISGARTPCSVCHDPHGVPSPGTVTNNSRLINFDTVVVRPSASGLLRFESTGTNRGRCYLTCHGQNHDPYSY